MENYYIINCPYCGDDIIIYHKEINCKKFRHGIYKHNYESINPHMSDKEANLLHSSNKIYGCGKYFTYDGVKISFTVDVRKI